MFERLRAFLVRRPDTSWGKSFRKEDLVGQRIARILVKEFEYDGYPGLDAGFVLENGESFSLSPRPDRAVYEFRPSPEYREFICERILGKQIGAFCYSVDEEGEAEFESIFIELVDGTCVSHTVCAPPGIGPNIYVRHRRELAVPDGRIRDYFEHPPVLPKWVTE